MTSLSLLRRGNRGVCVCVGHRHRNETTRSSPLPRSSVSCTFGRRSKRRVVAAPTRPQPTLPPALPPARGGNCVMRLRPTAIPRDACGRVLRVPSHPSGPSPPAGLPAAPPPPPSPLDWTDASLPRRKATRLAKTKRSTEHFSSMHATRGSASRGRRASRARRARPPPRKSDEALPNIHLIGR